MDDDETSHDGAQIEGGAVLFFVVALAIGALVGLGVMIAAIVG